MSENKNKSGRRGFLKVLGGGAAVTAVAAVGCKPSGNQTRGGVANGEVPTDQMQMRTTPTSGDSVSLLGYGMMRLPTVGGSRDGDIDQEQVNELVDYALAHGVNYFDTSPAYCRGLSEKSTGIALSRHPRAKYFVATK